MKSRSRQISARQLHQYLEPCRLRSRVTEQVVLRSRRQVRAAIIERFKDEEGIGASGTPAPSPSLVRTNETQWEAVYPKPHPHRRRFS